ncbi:MAG: hypothetical protein ACI4JJ_00920 [Huintestinicola sp.]
MRIKKMIAAFMAAGAVLAAVLSPKVCAENDMGELSEAYGISDGIASESLPYDAADFLAENNISPDDPDSISKLSPKTVLSYMWEKIKHSAASPLRVFVLILGAVLLSALTGAVGDSAGGETEQLYRVISVLICTALIVPYVESAVSMAKETLSCGSDFMVCYVPVMAGIAAASGTVTSAASYNVIVLFAAEAAVRIASELLMPVLSLCMAMGIIDAVNPGFSLSGITELLKKYTSVLLCFIMTVFTGLLSVQSIVGVSADTVGVKAAKFVVSNMIPVVGNAVADAYSTMRSGLGLLKGAAGAFGVIAIAAAVLPPIIETALLQLAVSAGEAAADMFGAKELKVLFKNTASVLSLIIALLSCFAVMFIVATIILMAAGLGGNV